MKLAKGIRFEWILSVLLVVFVVTSASAQVARNNGRPQADSDSRDIRLGGYLDLEYFKTDDDSYFKQHRLVPMIDATVSDSVHFAAEIEFEYGGTDFAGGGGETKVEYAYADVDMGGWALRSGAILVPLGATNLYHDSPMRELTNRPLVARSIIPSTFTSAGVGGLWGADDGSWSLEAYALNGFQGGPSDGVSGDWNINGSSGLRSARPSMKVNGDDRNLSLCGRLAWSPVLGTELGFSAWSGPWSDDGELDMSITVIDITTDLGSFVEVLGSTELEIEFGDAALDIDATNADMVAEVPEDMSAQSIQISRRFFPAMIENMFGDESSCGLTLRFEEQDLGLSAETERTTIGFNIRPTDETILKFDHETTEQGGTESDQFIFSVATYF